jgi:hypothetical protein
MRGRANGSWLTTALHVDGRGRSACLAYPHRTPIFEVAAGNAVIKVTLHANRVDDASVTFAQELAEQAHAFAREVERLHHMQINRRSKREGSKA